MIDYSVAIFWYIFFDKFATSMSLHICTFKPAFKNGLIINTGKFKVIFLTKWLEILIFLGWLNDVS